MHKFNRVRKLLQQTLLAVLLVGMMWVLPIASAQAVSADYSYSSGAPDNPNMKQKTLYEGRADRTLVDGGKQARGNTDSVVQKVDQTLRQENSDRPKTTGEWNREARETEGAPGKRGERIAKESAEAVKDFGAMYPDTAKRSGEALQDQ